MNINIDKYPPTKHDLELQRKKFLINDLSRFFVFAVGITLCIVLAKQFDSIPIRIGFVFVAIFWALLANHLTYEYIATKTSLLPSVSFLDTKFYYSRDLQPVKPNYSDLNVALELAPELKSYVANVIKMERDFYRFERDAIDVYTDKKAQEMAKLEIQSRL